MVTLGEKTYSAERKQLRDWLNLNEILAALEEATEHTDSNATADAVCRYVSVALGLDGEVLHGLPWKEVAIAYSEIQKINFVDVSHIAFTRIPDPKITKEPWDYTGRIWWTWAHDFAKAFGWTLEYIANLKVEDAFAMLQENLLSQYFEREWQWTVSEYSVKYNQTTKKTEPNPLPKPDWMKAYSPQAIQPNKPVIMRKDMIPVGNIVHPPKPEGRAAPV